MIYLTAADLVKIHQWIVETSDHTQPEIQATNQLQVVANLPDSQFEEMQFYPTMVQKAAILMQKIVKKHIFLDGNKRTAFIATATFLKLNHYDLNIDPISGCKFMNQIAAAPDDPATMQIIIDWLKQHCAQLV